MASFAFPVGAFGGGTNKRWIPRSKRKDVSSEYDATGEEIGAGMQAEVRLYRDPASGAPVAVKVMDKMMVARKTAVTEVQLLRRLTHAHIVGLREVFETETEVQLVLEYMPGGELLERIAARSVFTEKEAARIARQILSAVLYLHSLGIVHRDLKPENIVFTTQDDDADVKLVDFGLSKYLGEEETQTPCGTPAYIAPEIVERESYRQGVDVWAVACIIHLMLSGCPPFYHPDVQQMYENIKAGRLEFGGEAWAGVSDAARDLLARMLNVDPKERLTAQQAYDHPWFSQGTALAMPLKSPATLRDRTGSLTLPVPDAPVAEIALPSASDMFRKRREKRRNAAKPVAGAGVPDDGGDNNAAALADALRAASLADGAVATAPTARGSSSGDGSA